MLPRRCVTRQRQTAKMRIAICFGFVVLSFLTLAGFTLLPRIQAAEETLPDRRVSASPTTIQPKLAASYGKLPLGFEANQGQTDPQVRFMARGGGYTIFLTNGEAVLTLKKPPVVSRQWEKGRSQKTEVRGQERVPDYGRQTTYIGLWTPYCGCAWWAQTPVPLWWARTNCRARATISLATPPESGVPTFRVTPG